MKIFNISLRIVMALSLIILASCQPDEITVNRGPLFLGEVSASGTERATGLPVTIVVEENESKIPVDAVLTVSFSKALDEESVLAATTLTQEGTAVDAAISVAENVITIDPAAELAFGTKYTINLGSDIKAVDGGIVMEPMTRSFTTETLEPSVYDGRVFYMSFDNNYTESLSGNNATAVGTPGFSTETIGGTNSYAGASGAYLTFPTAGLLGQEFTAVFWMKLDATPDRAGVLVIGPPDPNNPATPNNRNHGFRFFRENASGKQRFKLNVGTGSSDNWFDGGAAADVDPAIDKWYHMAFTISPSEAKVYIDGKVVSQGALAGVSWTGTDIISIMSGAPRFTEWGHLSDESLMDELSIFNRALAQDEIQAIMRKENGEILYMPFDGNYKDMVSKMDATVVGTPGFAGESIEGADAYEGATGSYLTFPTTDLQTDEFSAAFWLNVNATPDRAGILVMGPPDLNNPATPNNRNNGFRLFREDAGGKQRLKLNVGNGTADSWFDGGAAADVDPATTDWVHVAFTISDSECKVYINGTVVSQGAFTGVDWTGTDVLSIMSGAPRFTEWGHLSDLSYMDELHIFNRALTEAEIDGIIAQED